MAIAAQSQSQSSSLVQLGAADGAAVSPAYAEYLRRMQQQRATFYV